MGRLKDDEAPICLQSCTAGGIKYGELEENKDENIFKASEFLMIKTAYKWERIVEPPKKR